MQPISWLDRRHVREVQLTPRITALVLSVVFVHSSVDRPTKSVQFNSLKCNGETCKGLELSPPKKIRGLYFYCDTSVFRIPSNSIPKNPTFILHYFTRLEINNF